MRLIQLHECTPVRATTVRSRCEPCQRPRGSLNLLSQHAPQCDPHQVSVPKMGVAGLARVRQAARAVQGKPVIFFRDVVCSSLHQSMLRSALLLQCGAPRRAHPLAGRWSPFGGCGSPRGSPWEPPWRPWEPPWRSWEPSWWPWEPPWRLWEPPGTLWSSGATSTGCALASRDVERTRVVWSVSPTAQGAVLYSAV